MIRLGFLANLKKLRRGEKLRLVWDIFMVWVALINLWMILFDISYLWLRPVYIHYLPVVPAVYDRVKGISPHPLTAEMLQTIETTRALLREKVVSEEIPRRVGELRALTARIFLEKPFARSGLEEAFKVVEEKLARMGGVPAATLSRGPSPQFLERLWPSKPDELRYRLEHLDPGFMRLLRLNYYREYGRGGRLVDYFWILDLPFLVLFWLEFLIRWFRSVRSREYARWFFFPIFNWYDVLGLMPMAFFRPFRLLRLVSVYMRLRESELSGIGKDYVSQLVEYFSNIITEEVSDRVALRILSEFEEEIIAGTHLRIAASVLEPRRRRVNRLLAARTAAVLGSSRVLEDFRLLARLNLEKAIEESSGLASIPLPQVVLRPLIRSIGDIVLDTTVETLSATLSSEEGREALEDLFGAMEADLLNDEAVEEIDAVIREIAVEVIARMKEVVAVKKWALPEKEDESSSRDEVAAISTDEMSSRI